MQALGQLEEVEHKHSEHLVLKLMRVLGFETQALVKDEHDDWRWYSGCGGPAWQLLVTAPFPPASKTDVELQRDTPELYCQR